MDEVKEVIHVQCAKEAEWGELKSILKSIDETQKNIRKDQQRIFKRIYGNGETGLVTESALNKQAIRRVWWWLGGISAGCLSLLAYLVRKSIE